MLILARTRRSGLVRNTRAFVKQMEQVMGLPDQGIKVVSNAGGLDPDHAEAVAEVAATVLPRRLPTSTVTTCCLGLMSCDPRGSTLSTLRPASRLRRSTTSRPMPTSARGASWGR